MSGEDNGSSTGEDISVSEESERDLVYQVIEAVADELAVDPVVLSPPLFDAVDPEALDTIGQHGEATVSFAWQGCTIEIGRDGSITVQQTEEP